MLEDGVYILVTRGRRTQHGHKTEYRVIVEKDQLTELIGWSPGYPATGYPVLHTGIAQACFGKARVFTDRKLAEGYSLALADERGLNDDRIVWIDQFADEAFPRTRALQALR